jgi:hypothetical protein
MCETTLREIFIGNGRDCAVIGLVLEFQYLGIASNGLNGLFDKRHEHRRLGR